MSHETKPAGTPPATILARLRALLARPRARRARPRARRAAPDPMPLSIPLCPEDVPESLREAMPRVRELAEYCGAHGLTFVGVLCDTDASARAYVAKGRSATMPVLAGFPPIMPAMLDGLGPVVRAAALEAVAEMGRGDA